MHQALTFVENSRRRGCCFGLERLFGESSRVHRDNDTENKKELAEGLGVTVIKGGLQTLESPLDCKESQPANPKGNQS